MSAALATSCSKRWETSELKRTSKPRFYPEVVLPSSERLRTGGKLDEHGAPKPHHAAHAPARGRQRGARPVLARGAGAGAAPRPLEGGARPRRRGGMVDRHLLP